MAGAIFFQVPYVRGCRRCFFIPVTVILKFFVMYHAAIDFQKNNFFGSQLLSPVISRKHLLRLSESYCTYQGTK
jgi:hypothetical protein